MGYRLSGPLCPVCVERGVIPPGEAQDGDQPCRAHEYEARLLNRPFVVPEGAYEAYLASRVPLAGTPEFDAELDIWRTP